MFDEYLYSKSVDIIYLIKIYDKSEKESITDKELKDIDIYYRNIVRKYSECLLNRDRELSLLAFACLCGMYKQIIAAEAAIT